MGLNYRHQSLFDREGSGAVRGAARILAPNNIDAEEINSLIEQLAKKIPEGAGLPHYAKVLRLNYTLTDKSLAEKSMMAQLPRSTYLRYLRDGVKWMAVQLQAFTTTDKF